MGERADAVVIGCGIVGANIAFQLARRGLKKVVVLEKSAIAAGASCKGGAIVGSHFKHDVKRRLARKSFESWINFNDVYGVKEHYFERRGQIWLGGAGHATHMRSIVEVQHEAGSGARMLSASDVHELAPQISLEDSVAFAYEPDGGMVDAIGATSAVAEAAHRAGADLRVGIAARAISLKHGHADGVKTDAGSISSPLVFNAANVWATRLLKPLGVRVPLTAARAQIGLFRRPDDFNPPLPIVLDLIQGTHICDYPGNLMLVGRIGRLREESAPDPDDYAENADWSVIRQFRDEVWRRFPIMRRSAFRGGFSGINDISPDSLPIIDRVPDAEGLFLACGFSGSGFCYAPAIGQLLTEWALDGAASIDIAALSLERFAATSSDDPASGMEAASRAGLNNDPE
jgi:sarcosine oxidase subunit beta